MTEPTPGRTQRHQKLLTWPLLVPVLVAWVGGVPGPLRAVPLDAEEQANCDRVSRIVEENSAPAREALERLARQRFGRGLSELSPEQLMQLSLVAHVEGRQMTAAQQQMQDRCAAYQQRQMAKDSAAPLGPARRAADSRPGARLPQHRSRRLDPPAAACVLPAAGLSHRV